MKKLLFACCSALWMLTSCSGPKEVYGDPATTAKGAVPAEQLLSRLEGKDSLVVKVEGKVTEVCQTKGCWMDMDLGNGQSMTVRFKDYGFFVPMNGAGRTVVVDGVAKIKTEDVAWLRHKAEDAGAPAEEIAKITEPRKSVTFLAKGVVFEP